MSKMRDNAESRTDMKKIIVSVIAVVLTVAVIFSANVITRADEAGVAVIATSTDADKAGIILDSDGYFRYYKEGVAYTTPGWISVNDEDLRISKAGHVTESYNTTTKVLSLYRSGRKTKASNLAFVLKDGYVYVFDANGVQVSKEGWYVTDSANKYYVSKNSRVTKKFVRSGSIINMYSYQKNGLMWKKYTNSWQTVDNKDYYFNKYGICTTVYDRTTRKASVLNSSKKFVPARNQMVTLRDGKNYYFNLQSKKTTKKGWYSPQDGIYMYVGTNGTVIRKVYRSNKLYVASAYNASKKLWVSSKNMWINTGSKLIYINKYGVGTKVYNVSSRTLYTYSAKTKGYVKVRNKLDKLNGTKYYFYNKDGVRALANGWKKASSTEYYYVSRSGYVTAKYISKNGIKTYFDLNYSKNSWVQRKQVWKNVGDTKYYFNNRGIATICYDSSTKRGYIFQNGKWKAITRTIRKIDRSSYYFDGHGRRVTKAGVYKTSNGYLAYVNGYGIVYKKEYDLSVKRNYSIDLGNGRTTSVYGYYELEEAQALMQEVNQYRIDNGLSPLKISTSLTETATTRAKEISNTYDHTRPNGTLCTKSMYELFGENLACGFSSGDLAFRAWTKSTAHDRNMLSTSYKTIGAAVFIALDNDKEGFVRYYVLTFGQ